LQGGTLFGRLRDVNSHLLFLGWPFFCWWIRRRREVSDEAGSAGRLISVRLFVHPRVASDDLHRLSPRGIGSWLHAGLRSLVLEFPFVMCTRRRGAVLRRSVFSRGVTFRGVVHVISGKKQHFNSFKCRGKWDMDGMCTNIDVNSELAGLR
jgi:hypothetical protein